MTTTDDRDWPCGVIAQCDECDEIAICRSHGEDSIGEPTGHICRTCYHGVDDD